MTNRFRIAVMALSTVIVAAGASALRASQAHAARICSNAVCYTPDTCTYQAGRNCELSLTRGPNGALVQICTEGQC